jgi:DNA polymerase-3 subunit beta
MKATIERAVLLKSLGHVQSVVERRNTIPILSNVLIEADASGQLKLMATDLDLQVVETIAAKVETPGTTTVSAPPRARCRSRRAARTSTCRRCRATISR